MLENVFRSACFPQEGQTLSTTDRVTCVRFIIAPQLIALSTTYEHVKLLDNGPLLFVLFCPSAQSPRALNKKRGLEPALGNADPRVRDPRIESANSILK